LGFTGNVIKLPVSVSYIKKRQWYKLQKRIVMPLLNFPTFVSFYQDYFSTCTYCTVRTDGQKLN